ncbi:MAG: amidophosphoribosyltransferase, partial [Christensenellales bacterium]
VEGVIRAAKQLKGAFSLIVMTSDQKLIAVRDPNAFRPLCIGENNTGVVFASESCGLDSSGFTMVRDVRPGEVLVAENGEITRSEICLSAEKQGLCIFEYVYFARPDSVIDNQSVYGARYNMGRILAREYPVDADAVCGVPDSGLEAAMGYAAESGLPLVSGFVKNRYIGRSFIFPTQAQRENAVRLKLNPLKANVNGKRIVLVDDSIVRGTTSAKIIRVLKQAGAKEVHMRISSPPFLHTCYFGTDIGSEKNLIANNHPISEVKDIIGADSLGYISVEGLKEACGDCSLPFCVGCFTGQYAAETGESEKERFEGR